MGTSILHDLDIILTSVVLGGFRASDTPIALRLFEAGEFVGDVQRAATVQVLRALRLEDASARTTLQDLRVRLALHLSPLEAVDYDILRPESRVSLIRCHLEKRFGVDAGNSESLARRVGAVLDAYDEERRGGLRAYLDMLKSRQHNRCAHCGLLFDDHARILAAEQDAANGVFDHVKPYWDGEGVRESMAAEVDHIDPIAGFGSNRADNLQALCRLCNRGKGTGELLRARKELEHSRVALEHIPRPFRISLLVTRLGLDNSTCSVCGVKSTEAELTVRRVHVDGLYVLTNLRTVCSVCSTRSKG